jgi:methionyl aminopeptidase
MIIIKSDVDIAKMRRSGKMTAETFHYIADFVKPGISTRVIDDKIEAFIAQTGGRPAFKGLYGFPASACISVNEEVVHGIPDGRILQEGDIVSIDLGVEYDGFFGDSAYTFAVGEISAANEKLLQTTQRALYEGIQRAVADNRLGDISNAIEKEITPHNYGIVRDLVGPCNFYKKQDEPPNTNKRKNPNGTQLPKKKVFYK